MSWEYSLLQSHARVNVRVQNIYDDVGHDYGSTRNNHEADEYRQIVVTISANREQPEALVVEH